MTGESRAVTSAVLDDSTLARAAARWGSFFASLDDDECELLDRFALGENLKTVCFELGLNYDTIRKRLVRRQEALGLPSTATFLHFWMRVRNLGLAPADPTMLRYAELLRASLGYSPSMVLPAPDESATVARLLSASWRPTPNAGNQERLAAEEITLALLSPAAWHAILDIATRGYWDTDRLIAVPAQHELFRALIAPPDSHINRRRVAVALQAALEASDLQLNERGSHIAPWLRALLFMQSVRSGLIRAQQSIGPETSMPSTCSTRCEEAFSSERDFAFWREVVRSLERGDAAHLQRVVTGVGEQTRFGPLTGLALSMIFFNAVSPQLRAVTSPIINRVISSRLRLAESLGYHPSRLLAYLSQRECGVSVLADAHRMSPGEKLAALSAEQSLPEVKHLATIGLRRSQDA